MQEIDTFFLQSNIQNAPIVPFVQVIKCLGKAYYELIHLPKILDFIEVPSSSWSGVVSLAPAVAVDNSSNNGRALIDCDLIAGTFMDETEEFSGVPPGADVGGLDGGYLGVPIFW